MYSCAAGMKKKSTAGTLDCATATCAATDASTCCEADTTKCGSKTVTCGAGKFQDPSKANTAAGADAAAMKANCCTAQATCDKFKAGATSTSAAWKTQTAVAKWIVALIGGLSLSQ